MINDDKVIENEEVIGTESGVNTFLFNIQLKWNNNKNCGLGPNMKCFKPD